MSQEAAPICRRCSRGSVTAVQIINITDPSSITAAGRITDGGSLVLLGVYLRNHHICSQANHTYAAVAAFKDDGVQILNITDPSRITAADSIDYTNSDSLELLRCTTESPRS